VIGLALRQSLFEIAKRPRLSIRGGFSREPIGKARYARPS
jgi:hypothetical protein